MKSDLDHLEDHIDDAKAKAADRRDDVEGSLEDVAGEPEGEQDASGGDDPVGADEADHGDGPDGSTDEDGDEREPAEVANPT